MCSSSTISSGGPASYSGAASGRIVFLGCPLARRPWHFCPRPRPCSEHSQSTSPSTAPNRSLRPMLASLSSVPTMSDGRYRYTSVSTTTTGSTRPQLLQACSRRSRDGSGGRTSTVLCRQYGHSSTTRTSRRRSASEINRSRVACSRLREFGVLPSPAKKPRVKGSPAFPPAASISASASVLTSSAAATNSTWRWVCCSVNRRSGKRHQAVMPRTFPRARS
jgi:hypothetical protein